VDTILVVIYALMIRYRLKVMEFGHDEYDLIVSLLDVKTILVISNIGTIFLDSVSLLKNILNDHVHVIFVIDLYRM
jgi:hypothetical protein